MSIVDLMFWAPVAFLMKLVWNIWGLIALTFVLGALGVAVVYISYQFLICFIFPGSAAYFELKRWQFDRFVDRGAKRIAVWRQQSTELIQNRVKVIREYPKR